LAGYLYQIVGVTGLSARAFGGSDEPGDLTYALIIEARRSRVFHELHGEDVVLQRMDAPDHSALAVQFKFSQAGATNEIQPAELRDILHAFDRCRRAAAAEFPVSAYALITNRSLSSSAQTRYDRRATPYASTRSSDRRWLSPPASRRPAVTAEYGSITLATQAWYAVLQGLTVYPRIGYDHWMRGLRAYTEAQGLMPEEFDVAVSRLVGEAMRATAAAALEVSREWLNSVVLGFSDARSLVLTAHAESARAGARELVARWLRDSLGPDEDSLVRRALLNAVADQAAQHPVVLLLGSGGCGKSVLGAHYLLEAASRCFVAVTPRRDLRPGWLGSVFNTWRSPTHGAEQAILPGDQVLRRLRVANRTTARPILILDIDGLDEWGEQEHEEVRRLLDFCLTHATPLPAEVVLIITARLTGANVGTARRNLIANLLSTDVPARMDLHIGAVLVDDFSLDELSAAARSLQSEAGRRIERSLVLAVPGTPPATTLGDDVPLDAAQGVATPDLLISLRHPVLWGEFTRLPEEAQRQVLDGTAEGLNRLAETFVERFCLKAHRRRSSLWGQRVLQALVRIGRGYPASEAYARRATHWIAPARGPITDEEAIHLFDEAVSYGVIREEEPGEWTWRHAFVGVYLRSQEE
jgi:hypothetical protein